MNPEPSAPPEYFSPPMSKGQRIMELINRYEIDPLFSEKLSILENYDIVLLLDDSGSMNTPLNDNTNHSTRWEELKSVVNIVISIATIYDSDGIDIHFLNRETYTNINSLEQVKYILQDYPQGGTPLTDNLQEIFTKFENTNKPTLVVIVTDGVPNRHGYSDLKNFRKLMYNKNHSKFFVSFLACSDQEADIGYLNELDKKVPNVDTLDDYISEKNEVLKAQGKNFSYTFGDHIVRLLLGPLCPELDKLDEKKLGQTCKCTIL